MFVESRRNGSNGAVNDAEIFAVHIIHNVIVAVLETAQFNGAGPMAGEEGIVHLSTFADRVRLRKIEADVVKISEILSARKHFLFIDAYPFGKVFLAFRSEVKFAAFRHQLRKHELRAHNSPDAYGGGEIVCPVA